MPAAIWLQENIPVLLRPSLLLATAVYHFFMTIVEVIFIERRPLSLFNITKLRYKSFARLWTKNGEAMSIEMPGPLTQLLSDCEGVVLDIGPGSGEILSRFDATRIKAMYGAEPAEDLHAGLLRNAEKHGFGDKYHALLCGGEPESLIPALHKSGILEVSGRAGVASDGVFDEICCVRVLCGVPHAQETINGLYHLLKPGGRMIICEHVVNPWRTEGRMLARLMQFVYTLLGWPFFMGGCELQRHTPDFLIKAGEWDKFDLKYYGPKDAIPFVVGELVKKGGKSYAEWMIIVGFSASSGIAKDTFENLVETGECVINTVSEDMVEAMVAISIDAPEGVSEWNISGLTEAPSSTVAPARVEESVFSIEGELVDVKELGIPEQGRSVTATALVKASPFWVRRDATNDEVDHIDVEKLRPVAQLRGMAYARVSETFEVTRRKWKDEIGWDAFLLQQ